VALLGDKLSILAKIKEAAQSVLFVTELSADEELSKVGLTSQNMVSFRSRLLDVFPKCDALLPNKVLFDCPTISSLAEYLMGRLANQEDLQVAQGIVLPAIERISVYITRGSTYPLSFNQEQMLRLQVMNPRSCAYNVSSSIWIAGGLDPEKLRTCLGIILNRHEVFSTLAVVNPPTTKMRVAQPHVAIIRVADEAAAL
jgi:hypothetical protein